MKNNQCKKLFAYVSLTVLSVFTFASVASATWHDTLPIDATGASGGLKYFGVLNGSPIWMSLINLNGAWGDLVDENVSYYTSCNGDYDYVNLKNTGQIAKFKFFNIFFPLNRYKEISQLEAEFNLAPTYDTWLSSGEEVYIKFKNDWGFEFEYSARLDDSGFISWPGGSGAVYFNDDPVDSNFQYNQRDYYYASLLVEPTYAQRIDLNSIEVGFKNGNVYGSNDQSRVTCVNLKYED